MTSMVEVDDYLMISALQHYAYCPRQCALIHVEKTWDENLYTMRGNRVHEVVNIPEDELIDGVRVERAMPLIESCLPYALQGFPSSTRKHDLFAVADDPD